MLSVNPLLCPARSQASGVAYRTDEAVPRLFLQVAHHPKVKVHELPAGRDCQVAGMRVSVEEAAVQHLAQGAPHALGRDTRAARAGPEERGSERSGDTHGGPRSAKALHRNMQGGQTNGERGAA